MKKITIALGLFLVAQSTYASQAIDEKNSGIAIQHQYTTGIKNPNPTLERYSGFITPQGFFSAYFTLESDTGQKQTVSLPEADNLKKECKGKSLFTKKENICAFYGLGSIKIINGRKIIQIDKFATRIMKN